VERKRCWPVGEARVCPGCAKPGHQDLQGRQSLPGGAVQGGDALSRGYTFAGPGIEAPGNAFVGAGAAGGATGRVGEGLLATLLVVRTPPALLLLLLVTTKL
jgi:hypothetical protein